MHQFLVPWHLNNSPDLLIWSKPKLASFSRLSLKQQGESMHFSTHIAINFCWPRGRFSQLSPHQWSLFYLSQQSANAASADKLELVIATVADRLESQQPRYSRFHSGI